MSLGEKIYRLRTEKNLSQGDLAEMLEVSRQSVSKWETNGSVPDLDKIIKLSNIFDVTLDELVLGKEGAGSSSTQNDDKSSEEAKASGFPPRKIAGTILLCMAFLVVLFLAVMGDFIAGLICAMPFAACGVVCFICKQHVGLWCAWTLYTIAEIFGRYMTGTNWSAIFYTFSDMKINRSALIMAWVEFACMLALIGITIFKFRNKPISTSGKTIHIILAGWVVLIILNLPMPFAKYMIDRKMFGLYQVCTTVLAWCRIVLFTGLATGTVQFWQSRRTIKKY